MAKDINSIVLVLGEDISQEDAESIMHAAMLFKGVIDVGFNHNSPESIMAEARARHLVRDRVIRTLLDVVNGELG